MGFTGMVSEPHFFVFFNAADSGAIGAELYYQAKVGSFRDSIRVLRESIRVSVFVWCICWMFRHHTYEISGYNIIHAK